MALQWGEYLATHVDWLDEQHKELFRHTNNFLDACDAGKGDEEILELLRFLDEYVDFHFRDEERFMKAEGYSLGKEHQRYHRAFVQDLAEFKKRFIMRRTTELVDDIQRFVVRWLLEHIAKQDKHMATEIMRKKIMR